MKLQSGPFLGALGLALAFITTATHAAPAAPLTEVAAQVQPAADQFRKGAPLPAWVEPVEALPVTQDKAALVTLLADTQFIAGAQRAQHVHLAWQVNAQGAVEAASRHVINFHPAYQRVLLHTLRVHRGGDTTVNKLGSSQFTYHQRAVRPEQAAYAGRIMTTIRMNDVRAGDIVEIAYTVEGANPAFGNKFAASTTWDSGIRTETRRVTLLHPQDRKIAWRMDTGVNARTVAPTETQSGEMRKLRWEAHAIAAGAAPGTPDHLVRRQYLQLSEYANWREVTRWAEQFFRHDVPATPELDALVAKLKAKPTAEERVSAALAWVQGEVRSFATVDLVETSQRPVAPGVVVERRFGDSRDKAFLMLHLLRELGVKARPVLVSREPRGTSQLLPSPYEFNEVIVRAEVDDQQYFLDPMWQGQGGKLAAMGQIKRAEVLVVQPGTDPAFIPITSTTPARNEREMKLRLAHFGDDGEIVVRETFTGAHAEVRRVVLNEVPRDAVQKGMLEDYAALYPGVQVAAPLKIKDDTANNVLTLVMKLRVPGIAAGADASWALRYGAPDFETVFEWHTRPDRNQVFALPLKSQFKYTVEAEFPPEVAVTSEPVNRSFRDDGFAFTLARRFSGNKAMLASELNTSGGLLPPKKVDAVTAGVRAIVQGEPGAFTVKKEDIKF